MSPQEYNKYFEDLIFSDNSGSAQKDYFTEV